MRKKILKKKYTYKANNTELVILHTDLLCSSFVRRRQHIWIWRPFNATLQLTKLISGDLIVLNMSCIV